MFVLTATLDMAFVGSRKDNVCLSVCHYLTPSWRHMYSTVGLILHQEHLLFTLLQKKACKGKG